MFKGLKDRIGSEARRGSPARGNSASSTPKVKTVSKT